MDGSRALASSATSERAAAGASDQHQEELQTLEEPSYLAIVDGLQKMAIGPWWANRARERPAWVRSTVEGTRVSHLVASKAPEPRSEPSPPWWEPSERQRLLQQLSTAVERGKHEEAHAITGGCGPASTASLIVRRLLVSPQQAGITHTEALACATTLASLCASQPVQVVDACGGLLEGWAIERLDGLWGANTERAAHLELMLCELLRQACGTRAGRRHTRRAPGARRVLQRLCRSGMLGERAKALLDLLTRTEAADDETARTRKVFAIP